MSGCIFSDDKKSESDSGWNAFVGIWGYYNAEGTRYHTLELFSIGQESPHRGPFVRCDYDINADGSRTKTWTGGGEFFFQLKVEEFAEDYLLLNFKDENGRLKSTSKYIYSISGNKLTLDGIVWTKE